MESPDGVLKGRCDSFVVESDVHFPTDVNLLYDAVRKTIECSAEISDKLSLKGWRHEHGRQKPSQIPPLAGGQFRQRFS